MANMERLSPTVFDIPIAKIRRGYYSAVYFSREKRILEKRNHAKMVLMQVFQKKNAILCGTDEAIAVLKLASGEYRDPERAYKLFDRYVEKQREVRKLRIVEKNYNKTELVMREMLNLEIELDRIWEDKSAELGISSLYDGDRITPWETVMTIGGLPQHFAHLESVYLGILARRTLVATNVASVVAAANGKPILFFADRFDHYENQTGDGYAATVGGVSGVATDIMGEWWGKKGMGTIPHALIACFGGDTVEATLAFAREFPEVPCISLVDFQNDCVRTSLEVADRFKAEGLTLYGVRLDTSETMVDESIIRNGQFGQEKPTGVTPTLVENVRRVLDRNGHDNVKIGVSGGFNRAKIELFEDRKVAVDFYGCGSSLLKGEGDFTADIVIMDGKPASKKGRWFRPNPRLERVS